MEKAIKIIKYYEDCHLKAFKPTDDPTEPWTIGWGRAYGIVESQVISQELADEWLAEDIDKISVQVKERGIPMLDNQFEAVVSFVYNLGIGRFMGSDLEKSIKNMSTKIVSVPPNYSMCKYLPDGVVELPEIQFNFLQWIKDGGTPLRGLYRRRYTESVLFLENRLVFPPDIPEK